MGAFRCGGCEGDDDAMVYNPIDNTAPQRAPTPQVFSAGEGVVDDGKTKIIIKIYIVLMKVGRRKDSRSNAYLLFQSSHFDFCHY